MLSGKQARIAFGMGAALIITLLLLALPGRGDPAAALPAAFRALASPALCIAAGVAFIARGRFFDLAAIDGDEGSPTIDLANRYLGNTVEQSVLAAMTWIAFAAVAPAHAASLLPILAMVFAVARALFAMGYAVAPWARAFGFALTFYPTLGVLILTLWRIVGGAG